MGLHAERTLRQRVKGDMSEGIDPDRFYAEMGTVKASISAATAQLAALTAEVRGDLAHGQRKLDDHEMRLRSLEAHRDKGSGASVLATRIVTAVIAVAGGGIGTALIQAIHH
jgi:hypothetical protein